MRFAAGGGGKVRSLILDSSRKDKIIQTLVEVATSKPVMPPQRIRPGAAKAAEVPPADAKLPPKADRQD
jgi:hypothetical protein